VIRVPSGSVYAGLQIYTCNGYGFAILVNWQTHRQTDRFRLVILLAQLDKLKTGFTSICIHDMKHNT